MDQTKSLRQWRRPLMIVTGLILFAFMTSHMVNLMLGFHSIWLMDEWRWALSGIWGGRVTGPILLVALVIHFAMALWSLYLRNTLRVSPYDMVQIIAGLLIIPLLAPHVIGVIGAKQLVGDVSYQYLLQYFWASAPYEGFRQVLMLVVAWVHGAVGLFTWLQSKALSHRAMRWFSIFIVAVPIVAALGYVEAGRQVIPQSEGGTVLAINDAPHTTPAVTPPLAEMSGSEIQAVLDAVKTWNLWLFWGTVVLVLGTFSARWVRVSQDADGKAEVVFSGERPATFAAPTGLSLLEMSRINDVPHANLCRGRGRCGTCRVRVIHTDVPLTPPTELEQKVLDRWQSGPDVRLACQIEPSAGRIEVERVVLADYSDLDYDLIKGVSPAGAK